MKYTFAARTFKARTFGSRTLAGPRSTEVETGFLSVVSQQFYLPGVRNSQTYIPGMVTGQVVP